VKVIFQQNAAQGMTLLAAADNNRREMVRTSLADQERNDQVVPRATGGHRPPLNAQLNHDEGRL
jgi:hypothetical protein